MQHIQNYAPKISDSFFFSGATSLRAVHIASMSHGYSKILGSVQRLKKTL